MKDLSNPHGRLLKLINKSILMDTFRTYYATQKDIYIQYYIYIYHHRHIYGHIYIYTATVPHTDAHSFMRFFNFMGQFV